MSPATRPEAELEAIVCAGTEALMLRVGAAFAAQEGWADQLRAVAWELRDFLVEDEDRARAMVLEAPYGNEETRRARENGVLGLTALIDVGRGELADPDSVPARAAEIAAGTIYNRIHVGVEEGVDSLDGEMVRELMYSAVLPYLGVEPALAELSAPRPAPTVT